MVRGEAAGVCREATAEKGDIMVKVGSWRRGKREEGQDLLEDSCIGSEPAFIEANGTLRQHFRYKHTFQLQKSNAGLTLYFTQCTHIKL